MLQEQSFKAYLAAGGEVTLLAWIEENVRFPCSVVDRISPKPLAKDAEEIRALFGRENDATVVAEDFVQWVVGGEFAGPHPDLPRAGVQFVADAHPYEEAKIRILNGGHTCLVYLAALSGLKTYDEAMRAPKLLAHFNAYETLEVLPSIADGLPFSAADYLATVTRRFCNTHIADSVERIAMDGLF